MEIYGQSSLPPEIMVGIFLLLPLDSLLICKLVSKVWKNLVEDSLFFKIYNAESTTLTLKGNVLYCLFRRDNTNSCTVRRIPMILNNCPFDGYLHQHYLYVEKSNKIACVKSPDCRFQLYNILTGDLRVVDDAPDLERSSSWHFFGFGYDSYADDYKIMVGSRSKYLYMFQLYANGAISDVEEYVASCRIFVYSYRNRDWQLFDGFPNYLDYTFFKCNAAYCFNGHLHWCVAKIGKPFSKPRLVGALDVHHYRLDVFALPPPFEIGNVYAWQINLTEFDGCLCCTLFQSNAMDVWVMKEYGVAESWTKLFSICISSLSTWSWYEKKHSNIKLYKCQNEKEIVVLFQHKSGSERFMLFRYHMNHNTIQVFSTPIREERRLQQRGFLKKLIVFGKRMLGLKNNKGPRF